MNYPIELWLIQKIHKYWQVRFRRLKIINSLEGKCDDRINSSDDSPSHRINIEHLPIGLFFIQIGNYSEKFEVVR